jgi:hypothetical protein
MDTTLFGAIPYIPGSPAPSDEPLSRYLPPIPNGVISSWLIANIPAGSLILDPFGASPRIILEAAHAGYPVIVTANNPIVRFLLEVSANPPSSEELRASLAELAASYIGEERIEPHIRALYNTYCARCGQVVSASAFLWEHDNPAPYARIYTCPSCGDSGEHPGSSYDAARASQISSSRLHKARALERVVAANDQDRIHVEQALSVYIPRALYALITILNKIQALNISAEQQNHLAALLLYAFDQSNAMWRVESPGDRRRSLTIPRHFRENNVWNSLEEGIEIWGQKNDLSGKTSIPLTIWPELPPATGGICIFEGRFVNLIDSLQNIDIKSVCAAIPRPNQAFWTLSALWAGWLWGRDAVGRFKSVLHRQRYDWAWHATALSSVFKPLVNYLDPSIPIFGIIGEAEPAFIVASLVAANLAGCHLESIAIRPEENQAQINWKSESSSDTALPGEYILKNAVQSAQKYLETTAEPTSYLNTMAAAFMGAIEPSVTDIERNAKPEQQFLPGIASLNESTEQPESTPSIIYSTTYNQIRESLTYRSGFLQYNLQDIVNFESTIKAQSTQSSLFSLDTVENVEEKESGIEQSSLFTENEPPSDKERLTRSADITESTLLWLRETNQVNQSSLSDKYEAFISAYLYHNPGCAIHDIDHAICQAFPGLFTPGSQFLRICLESYGQPDPNNEDRWYLRLGDDPDERKVDVEQSHDYLYKVGYRLGFECKDAVNNLAFPYIRWISRTENIDYWFFVTVSSLIGEIVLFGNQPQARGYIVFPGSRANLLLYKLSRDLRLNKAFTPSQGVWRFLKFRHLKSLSETPLLNRENLDQFLSLDPLTFARPQLWLI